MLVDRDPGPVHSPDDDDGLPLVQGLFSCVRAHPRLDVVGKHGCFAEVLYPPPARAAPEDLEALLAFEGIPQFPPLRAGGTVPDLSPEEKDRRNAAIEQAGHIRAYLPQAPRPRGSIGQGLEEIKGLIADELRAFDDFVFESDSTLEQIARRDRERATQNRVRAYAN